MRQLDGVDEAGKVGHVRADLEDFFLTYQLTRIDMQRVIMASKYFT